MNRSLWKQTLSSVYCPPWPCPVCKKGTIALVPKSLAHKENVESQRSQGHEAWDPDWISYVFTAWAECRHPTCKQQFAVSGTGGVSPAYDGEGATIWEDNFQPVQCHPMP